MKKDDQIKEIEDGINGLGQKSRAKRKTRSAISNRISAKEDKVKDLEDEIKSLKIERIQITDKAQRYEEKTEEFVISLHPKKTREELIGRVYWIEDFVDEGTGKVFPIERNAVVMRGGVFVSSDLL
jgi:uncharacterized coiled-coil DUF342 family protein